MTKNNNAITWIHLSDIHCRTDDAWNMDIVLKALLKDIQTLQSDDELRLKPDFILVTGDIAFSGKPEEYALAAQFFDKLLKAGRVERDCLSGSALPLVEPDVQISRIRLTRKAFVEGIHSGAA